MSRYSIDVEMLVPSEQIAIFFDTASENKDAGNFDRR
jgi:hypothetical protein